RARPRRAAGRLALRAARSHDPPHHRRARAPRHGPRRTARPRALRLGPRDRSPPRALPARAPARPPAVATRRPRRLKTEAEKTVGLAELGGDFLALFFQALDAGALVGEELLQLGVGVLERLGELVLARG